MPPKPTSLLRTPRIHQQAANGLLLPVIAIFLLIIVNREDLIGLHRNGKFANITGILVVLVVSALGLFKLVSTFLS